MSTEPVMEKLCSHCRVIKSLNEFSVRNDRIGARKSRCKLCEAEYQRVRYAANAEKEKDRKRAYREANAEKVKEQDRARREANPEKFRAQQRAYRATNPDKISHYNRTYRQNNLEKVKSLQQIWYIANFDKVSEQQRVYRQNNPDVIRAKSHRRRTRLKNNGGSCTGAQLRDLRITQNHQCAYCQRRVKLNIEHIVPVKRGGSSDISNICWACRRCNLNKGAKRLEEWVNRWYEMKNEGSV